MSCAKFRLCMKNIRRSILLALASTRLYFGSIIALFAAQKVRKDKLLALGVVEMTGFYSSISSILPPSAFNLEIKRS